MCVAKITKKNVGAEAFLVGVGYNMSDAIISKTRAIGNLPDDNHYPQLLVSQECISNSPIKESYKIKYNTVVSFLTQPLVGQFRFGFTYLSRFMYENSFANKFPINVHKNHIYSFVFNLFTIAARTHFFPYVAIFGSDVCRILHSV